MTTYSVSMKSSLAANLRQRFAGNPAMSGEAGVIVRKLINGQRLSAMERELSAMTGLAQAVGELAVASDRASNSQGGLLGAKNTADVFIKTRNVLNKVAEADHVYSQNYKTYGKLSSAYHQSKVGQVGAVTQPVRDKIFRAAGDVVTVAGLGLSAASLPGLAKKTATSFTELNTLVFDPNATTNQRLDKLEEFSRAGAGTVFSAQGVVTGTRGTMAILSRNKTLASVMTGLSEFPLLHWITRPISKSLGVLLPVADGAVFVGEVIAAHRTFTNAEATEKQKLRSGLNLSLAGLRTAFWIFPQVRFLRSIYGLAGLGQLGLTLWDLRTEMVPKIISAAKSMAWAVAHPVLAAKAIGTGLKNTVGKAAGWLWDKVSHPGQTLSDLGHGISAWYNALWNKSRTTVSDWFGPKAPVVAQSFVPAPAAQTPVTAVQTPVTAAQNANDAFAAASAQLDAMLPAQP